MLCPQYRGLKIVLESEQCNWYEFTHENLFSTFQISSREGNTDEEEKKICIRIPRGLALTMTSPNIKRHHSSRIWLVDSSLETSQQCCTPLPLNQASKYPHGPHPVDFLFHYFEPSRWVSPNWRFQRMVYYTS
ncbi:hypothetical protein ABKN59_007707 [Abortiporus biennis]